MDSKLNRLYKKAEKLANPPKNTFEKLLINNPFLSKSYTELLDCLDGSGEVYSDWPKFICALINASENALKPITENEVAYD